MRAINDRKIERPDNRTKHHIEDRGGQRPELNLDDLRGALAVFLIVVMSTVPVILPFIFLQDLSIAMRISNAIAVAMLALIGFAYGRASGISAWWMSGSMVLLGCVLVGLTLALGG